MNIGEKIRTYRRNCKLTQKELGEKIGVSDKTISSWENSRTMPDLEMDLKSDVKVTAFQGLALYENFPN